MRQVGHIVVCSCCPRTRKEPSWWANRISALTDPPGAILISLITLLHNYVSYEFAQDKKRFSSIPLPGTLLLAHGRLPAFLCVTGDLVVARVGTDVVLRKSLQQVCG
eukprot:1088612-Rhodomonas_salina.5